MKKLKILLSFSFIFVLLNIGFAVALPAFSDVKPLNNTFTYGKDSDTFSVNISDPNLDTSTVVHRIRVNELGATIFNTTSSCSNIGSGNWYCSNTVLTFGSIGGDGKTFIYYFDANNTTGSSNSGGNYFVTIDRSAPQIFPNSFSNNSYISGNFQLSFSINDAYSGVNSSSAQFMYGNTTFNSTFQSFTSSNPFTAYLDTRNFVDNSTYFIYVNVSDNIGNGNITKFQVYIDNEIPTLSIVLPTTNSSLKSITYFQITSTDTYSGVNMTSATYTLDSNNYSIPCAGTNSSAICTTPLINTSNFTDGFKTINFNINDNAGNLKTNSTTFYIDNNPPVISINYPSNGAAVSGQVPLVSTITDLGSGLNMSEFRWENSTLGDWSNMSCSGTNCTGTLDSTSIIFGNYTLKVNATGNSGLSSTQSVLITVDNIPPNIVIQNPNVNQQISGNFLMNITTTDNYGLPGRATYSAGNTSGSLTCNPMIGNQSFSCFSLLNSSIFSDGQNFLRFTTRDMAGNSFSTSINVSFDNQPPVIANIVVYPSTSKVPTTFKIEGNFTDLGSHVASASGTINLPSGKTSAITFTQNGGKWDAQYIATENGKYKVDVTLVDTNSHSGTYLAAASFFVGTSKCGDGICDPTENYCTCPQDCTLPSCKSYEIVNCKTGIPVCVNSTGCGNGICETDENASTCPADCALTSGNQTGGFGNLLGGNMILIFVIIAVAVAGVLAYLFWPNKQKPVYPGFKPKDYGNT